MELVLNKISIKDYYNNKYLTMASDVLSYLAALENDKLYILNGEIESLNQKLENIDELLISNDAYINEIAKYEEEIRSYELKLENIVEEINKINEAISRKSIILTSKTNKIYDNVLTNYLNSDEDIIGNCISEVFSEFYSLNLEIRDLKFNLFDKERKLYNLQTEFETRHKEINRQVSELSLQIRNLTKEELILIRSKKIQQVESIKEHLEDLVKTFEVVSEKQQAELNDRIDYLSLTNSDAEEVVDILDELLFDMEQSLKVQKTLKEIDRERRTELKKLQDELENSYVSLDRYDLVKASISEIKEKLENSNNIYNSLIEHKNNILSLFKDDDILEKKYQNYSFYIERKNDIMVSLTNLSNDYNDLLRRKSDIEQFKNQEDKLREIENAISKLLDNKAKLNSEYQNACEWLKTFENDIKNSDFIKVYNDLNKIQSIIPDINSKINTLNSRLSKLNDEFKQMNDYILKKKDLEEKINNLIYEIDL